MAMALQVIEDRGNVIKYIGRVTKMTKIGNRSYYHMVVPKQFGERHVNKKAIITIKDKDTGEVITKFVRYIRGKRYSKKTGAKVYSVSVNPALIGIVEPYKEYLIIVEVTEDGSSNNEGQ